MIKSKLDARERALELAVKCFDAQSRIGASNVVGFANVFERYLIDSAELPEFVSNVDDMLEAVELLKKQMPEFSKNESGQMEFLLPAPKDRKLMSESESEDFKAMLVERGYIAQERTMVFGDGNSYKKSFDGFELHLYISRRVGGYMVSSSVSVGDGVDAPRFMIPDYNLDVDRIEGAALKHYECHRETIGVNEGA